MLQSLRHRLAVTSRQQRLHVAVLCLFAALAMVHQIGPRVVWTAEGDLALQWRIWEWYIEDSAISFAFARNWAAGDGLVANPGGERVEGYSNPLWVFLMAGWYLVGVSGFVSSKWMALGLGGVTIGLVYAIARESLPEQRRNAALLAPAFLAASSQFAIWNASGLENSLFCALLAAGIWRTLVEARRGGFPWSAIFYMLLAITRPEGILYGALGGFWGMVAAFRAGQGVRRTLVWLAAFFIPFTLYHVIRYQYFAWPFPNTYYAKLGSSDFQPFSWNGRGWKYIRAYGHHIGSAYLLPVILAGVVGLRGPQRWFTAVFTLVAGGVLLYPGTETLITAGIVPPNLPTPDGWIDIRIWTLCFLAVGAPLVSIGTTGWLGRTLSWGTICLVIFFCLKANGDWMKGWRWMSFLTVPLSVLLACGAVEITDLVQRALGRRSARGWTSPGWVALTLMMAAVIAPNLVYTATWMGPRETGPFSVRQRVEYSASVQERLFIDRPRNLDVDQGGHLYWSDHEMLDIAGLIDVSMAHHQFEKPFIKEYIFREKKPEFAHVHGSWASNSRLTTFPEWRRDYFEIPGYGGQTLHMGNHIRLDLMFDARWTGQKQPKVPFEEGPTMVGLDVPSREVSSGERFYLEVGFEYRRTSSKENFRVLGFVANEQGDVHSFDLPMGYDWKFPVSWKLNQIFHGRFAPQLPSDLPEGTYDIGFVVLGDNGAVLSATTQFDPAVKPLPLPDNATIGGPDGHEPRVAVGEIRFQNMLVIGPAGFGEDAAEEDYRKALQAAEEQDCDAAEAHWNRARRHVPRNQEWQDEHAPALESAQAKCLATASTLSEHRIQQVNLLEEARRWDPRQDAVWNAARPLADALYAEGEAAAELEDWATAYRAFSDCVRADPTRSWARRRAEETRDLRLRIDAATLEQEAAERAKRLEDLRERREKETQDRAKGILNSKDAVETKDLP